MPVVVASATRSADALISYALDDKPNQTGERYVMASGVGGLLVSVAKQQMRDVRKRFNKDKPGAFVHAYHVIESFAKNELDPDDPDSWMTAQRLGRALAADRFPGRQVLVVTQRDGKTGCVHNHIIANSIETRTGASLNSSAVMHSRLVEAHERVLEAEGFEQRADLKQAFADATDRRERGERSDLRRGHSTARAEEREYDRYLHWEVDCEIADEFGAEHPDEPFSTTVLKWRITQTLEDPSVTGWASFVAAGRTHGVDVEQRGGKGRGISYGMLRERTSEGLVAPSPSDRRRSTTLGVEFEMDAVEAAFTRRRSPEIALTANIQPQISAAPPASSAFPRKTHHLSETTAHDVPSAESPTVTVVTPEARETPTLPTPRRAAPGAPDQAVSDPHAAPLRSTPSTPPTAAREPEPDEPETTIQEPAMTSSADEQRAKRAAQRDLRRRFPEIFDTDSNISDTTKQRGRSFGD